MVEEEVGVGGEVGGGVLVVVVGGWVLATREVTKMFYRIVEMVQGGQRVTYEYENSDRDKMLEWVKLLLAQSDTAYVDVMLIDDDGTCTNRKFVEGRAYGAFNDNI